VITLFVKVEHVMHTKIIWFNDNLTRLEMRRENFITPELHVVE